MKESWSKYSVSIEKSREYHKRYQIAVNSPLRRKILKMLKEGKDLDLIMREANLDKKDLEYHLQILEWGFCIHRKDGEIEVTKEGEVVDYIE